MLCSRNLNVSMYSRLFLVQNDDRSLKRKNKKMSPIQKFLNLNGPFEILMGILEKKMMHQRILNNHCRAKSPLGLTRL